MDGRKRMERTLLYLVLSMTLGALILHLGQPNRVTARTAWTGLIGQTPTPPPITVYICRQRAGAADDTHFFIDRQGKTSPTDSWVGRKFGDPQILRVGVQTPSHSGVIAKEQWSAAAKLFVYLRQKLDGATLKLDLEKGVHPPQWFQPAAIAMQ